MLQISSPGLQRVQGVYRENTLFFLNSLLISTFAKSQNKIKSQKAFHVNDNNNESVVFPAPINHN